MFRKYHINQNINILKSLWNRGPPILGSLVNQSSEKTPKNRAQKNFGTARPLSAKAHQYLDEKFSLIYHKSYIYRQAAGMKKNSRNTKL